MTRPDMPAILIRCLTSGDLASALAIWRSSSWDDHDRLRARQMLTTARDMALEVLP